MENSVPRKETVIEYRTQSNNMKNILVYSATGLQAAPLIEPLTTQGYYVYALTRDKEKSNLTENQALTVVEADLSIQEEVEKATEGMDVVMLNLPFFSDDRAGIHAIEASKKAGVKLIVWNANGEVPQGTTNRHKMNIRMENMERLVESGIPYIVFQPTIYLENLLIGEIARSIKKDNSIQLPMPAEAPIPWISTYDISDCMVNAISRQELYHSVLTVRGEGWTGYELAEVFSRALSRPISYKQIDLGTYVRRINLTMGEGAGEEIMGLTTIQSVESPREAKFPKFNANDGLEKFQMRQMSLADWVELHRDYFEL